MMVLWLHTCLQMHQVVLKNMHSILCVYLKKVVKKKKRDGKTAKNKITQAEEVMIPNSPEGDLCYM